jgi:uncharacterized protein YecE (DUF72 family)
MNEPLKHQVPLPYRPGLKVGTSSWKYDSWKGLVYDEHKRYGSDDYLSDYAKLYNTVEVDQWFWSLFPSGVKLPDPVAVKKYAAAVPSDFTFAVKAPNAITLTHYYSKQPAKHKDLAGQPNPHFLDLDILNRFVDGLAPMDGKLGPIMFQFEYLNRRKMGSRRAFEDRLGAFIQAAPFGFQYAVEVRNPQWLVPEFFSFLTGLGVGFVYLEGYYMPPIAEVFKNYQPVTAGFTVVRLHGKDRSGIEKVTGEVWDRVVEPHPAGLEAAAAIVRHNRARESQTYLYINNHFEGSAPRSIDRFLEILARPDWT